jgi:hypothetical protein
MDCPIDGRLFQFAILNIDRLAGTAGTSTVIVHQGNGKYDFDGYLKPELIAARAAGSIGRTA